MANRKKIPIPEMGDRIRIIADSVDGVKAVARHLDVSVRTVESWIREGREPCAYHLRTLAKLGMVSVDWIVALTDEEADQALADCYANQKRRDEEK